MWFGSKQTADFLFYVAVSQESRVLRTVPLLAACLPPGKCKVLIGRRFSEERYVSSVIPELFSVTIKCINPETPPPQTCWVGRRVQRHTNPRPVSWIWCRKPGGHGRGLHCYSSQHCNYRWHVESSQGHVPQKRTVPLTQTGSTSLQHTTLSAMFI